MIKHSARTALFHALVASALLIAALSAGPLIASRPTRAAQWPDVKLPPLSAPGGLVKDGEVLYAVSPTREPGVYEDVSRLFFVRFPTTWRMVRSTGRNGGFVYTLSAEAGRTPLKQIRTGVKIESVVMSDLFQRQRMTPADIARLLLPAEFQSEPGMKLVGSITSATLGALQAAMYTTQGTLKDLSGEFTEETYIAVKEGTVFELWSFAPKDEYAALRPTFQKIVADSRFGRTGLPRREQSMEARQITQKYKASVVSIMGSMDQKAWTGTGFIISRDGYILTNYHVAYDTEARQPAKSLKVEWDDSLKRPSVSAQIIGGKYQMGAFSAMNYGTDVALLKIPPGDYEPMPLSPMADVEVGDDLVTLGFPSRGMLEGISLTVTKGVVTRFNRGAQGEVQSIFIDAPTTHGSSGGPCVSLVTGGVIGLNSFGHDVQLDERFARFNDLINYNGVVPIDAAIREFPLVCIPGLDPQGAGLDFLDTFALSRFFLSIGSLSAAQQIAARGVSLEPKQAVAHTQLGECLFRQGVDLQSAGDPQKADTLLAAARRAYEQGLAQDPRQTDTLVASGRLAAFQNRLSEATDLGTRAIASDSRNLGAILLLAEVSLRQSRFDEALRYAEKAKEVTGRAIVNPFFFAASVYIAKKDFEKARQEWVEAARISPVYLVARLGVAECLENLGQLEAALAEYKRILNDFKDNGEVLGRIGLCLNRAGRTAEAVNYFGSSVERGRAANQPPSEDVLLQLGGILMQDPQRDLDAVTIYAMYLGYYPRGQWTAATSLRLALIHAKHQGMGLASAHARLAVTLRNAPDVAQAAAQYPPAPLSLEEIKVMLQLGYPLPLEIWLVENSPLGFTVQDEQQFLELGRQGIPGPIQKAILSSLNRRPLSIRK